MLRQSSFYYHLTHTSLSVSICILEHKGLSGYIYRRKGPRQLASLQSWAGSGNNPVSADQTPKLSGVDHHLPVSANVGSNVSSLSGHVGVSVSYGTRLVPETTRVD